MTTTYIDNDKSLSIIVEGQPHDRDGGIYIHGRGKEIVCWVADEWHEDPGLAHVIATHILYAVKHGSDRYAETIKKKWNQATREWEVIR